MVDESQLRRLRERCRLEEKRKPVAVLMRINMPSPSGYCGAVSSIRHRGKTNTPSSSTDATASRILESLVTVSSVIDGRTTGEVPYLTWRLADRAGRHRLPERLEASDPVICALAFGLMFATSATADPAGDTRTYPCVSWCSAEQKSVQ